MDAGMGRGKGRGDGEEWGGKRWKEQEVYERGDVPVHILD